MLNGQDVTEAIRNQGVTQWQRRWLQPTNESGQRLVDLQACCRMAGQGIDLVTEGRDQGTVVFPDAECKFYLTASAEERARRRQRELQVKGEHIPLEELLVQQQLRDTRDETRACSPLKPADDAFVIDSTAMTLDRSGRPPGGDRPSAAKTLTLFVSS